jgi:HEAT repeat protein
MPNQDSDIAREIILLQNPFGDEPARSEHERAAEYLLAHAAGAHPRLLDLLRSDAATNPYAIIELLPRFGLPDSIPVLKRLLDEGPPNLAGAAARALAVHPLADARTVLLSGLDATTGQTIIAATNAFLALGDPSICPVLRRTIDHPDPDVRYHLVHAAGALGCLDRETLASISAHDPSEQVRELARTITAARQPGLNR